jgi:hypothetical protein
VVDREELGSLGHRWKRAELRQWQASEQGARTGSLSCSFYRSGLDRGSVRVSPRRKGGGNHGAAHNDPGVQGSPAGGAVGGPAGSTSERGASGNAFPGGSGCGSN